MAAHPSAKGIFYIVESDHRTLSPSETERRIAALKKEPKPAQRGVLDLDASEFGPIRAEAGQWASCIRVVDAVESTMVQCIELENNEAAFSVAVVPFANRRNASTGEAEQFVVVSSAVEASISPRTVRKAYLTVYKLSDDGKSLTLHHRTEVEDVSLAMRPFQGRLLVGVGKILRIYDLGQKKLLRKCENRSFPSTITSLQTQGSRIIVGDMQESTIFTTYKVMENRLITFADDVSPRWTTALTMLDYDTVAAGDKFGNIFINRLDSLVSKHVDEDPSGTALLHEKPFLQGNPHRLSLQAHFHIGDIVTSLHRVSLSPGGKEGILYTCLGGTIGMLVPFVSKADVEMLSTLEMHLRQEASLVNSPYGVSSLVGRDHLAYRGYYVPVKAVIDGDLCEKFGYLSYQRQQAIAEELGLSPADVNKKLEGLRVGSAF